MTEDEILQGVQQPGKFDATVASEADALRIVRTALPRAIELPAAVAGKPYPSPPRWIKAWFQTHLAESSAGNNLPHVKYADWTRGKKGRGGSWGLLFFPPPVGT